MTGTYTREFKPNITFAYIGLKETEKGAASVRLTGDKVYGDDTSVSNTAPLDVISIKALL